MSIYITNQSNLNHSYNDRWNSETSHNYSRHVRERSRSRERYSSTRYHSSRDEEERINSEIIKKKQELANILKETHSYNYPESQTKLSTSDINIERLLQEAVYSGSKIPSPSPPPPLLPHPQIQSSYEYHKCIPKITVVKCNNTVTNSRKFFFDRIDKLLKNNKNGLINGSHFPRSTWPLRKDGSMYFKLNDIAYDFDIKYRIITGTFYFDFT